MKYQFTKKFIRNYHHSPQAIQLKFDKQLIYLLQDFHHPSLQTKKYDKQRSIWQARVDISYRFYFIIQKDTYVLLNIREHPK